MPITNTRERSGPPLPRAAYTVVNPIIKAVLRSPLHHVVSDSLMTLSFTGRKSSKHYSIPVGYVQHGTKLFVFSHSAQSNNFRDGAPVMVRLRGKPVQGIARSIEDRERTTEMVGMLVAKHGDAMARRMGLVADGQSTPRHTTFVEIALKELAP